MDTDNGTDFRIDLNADLGEGFGAWSMGEDAAMLALVTTANIACGGHAGDPRTMRRCAGLAAAAGVAITAHVSYPDLQGFGRRFLDMEADDLRDLVIAQTGALQAVARAEGAAVRGVKPHGALYNALARHPGQAAAVVAAMADLGGDLALVAAPGSEAARRAEKAGIPVVLEAFADRAYRPDGTLVPRTAPGAVRTDQAEVLAQVLRIARTGAVLAEDGTTVRLDAASICLHGDTPGAVDLARAVRRSLEEAGIRLAPALP
ncbi:LamB/YcsF family protein [Brachybacterium hainanense]|uniref:5-oxoprolinase subunit A n=1 Tax=Brachybacterium hainanense TaxID=1541174 RepID=A0ABV6R6W9_9MICO